MQLVKPLPIDYAGQELAGKLLRLIIALSTVRRTLLPAFSPTHCLQLVGLVLGFFLQSFAVTSACIGVGTVVALFAVVPPWPYLRASGLEFLAPAAAAPDSTAAKAD
jgi:hypothetical protein